MSSTPNYEKLGDLLQRMRVAVDNNKPEVSDLLRELAKEIDAAREGKVEPEKSKLVTPTPAAPPVAPASA